MAKAPKVKAGGHEAAKQRRRAAGDVYRVTAGDLSFTYAPNNLPVRVRARIRDEFSMSVEQWLFGRGEIDLSSYADVWWVARLAAGEDVTRSQVHDEWDERCAGVQLADVTDALVDEDTDPEA